MAESRRRSRIVVHVDVDVSLAAGPLNVSTLPAPLLAQTQRLRLQEAPGYLGGGDDGASGRRDELMEGHAPSLGRVSTGDRQSLLARGTTGSCRWGGDLNRRTRRRQGIRGQTRQILGGGAPPKLRQEGRKMRLEARPAAARTVLPHPSVSGVFFAALKARHCRSLEEQEIAGLRSAPRTRCHPRRHWAANARPSCPGASPRRPEFRGTRQVQGRLHKRDSSVTCCERNLGDIEFLARYQRQQKIERTFKNRERDSKEVELPEPRGCHWRRRHGHDFRASRRYVGACVVGSVGDDRSVATDASGNPDRTPDVYRTRGRRRPLAGAAGPSRECSVRASQPSWRRCRRSSGALIRSRTVSMVSTSAGPDAAQREELRLHGDDDAVRCRRSIDRKQAEGGLAVDEDRVVVCFDVSQNAGQGNSRGRPPPVEPRPRTGRCSRDTTEVLPSTCGR